MCHARSGEVFQPPESQQENYCNCGYARGVCDRFPAEAPADAVRFSVTRERTLFYILEKDHAPVEFGPLQLDGGQFGEAHLGPILSRQAHAFLESNRALL